MQMNAYITGTDVLLHKEINIFMYNICRIIKKAQIEKILLQTVFHHVCKLLLTQQVLEFTVF